MPWRKLYSSSRAVMEKLTTHLDALMNSNVHEVHPVCPLQPLPFYFLSFCSILQSFDLLEQNGHPADFQDDPCILVRPTCADRVSCARAMGPSS